MNNSTHQEYYGLDMEATGKRIGRYLTQGNYSDKDLAEIMNISVQAINKWRHGHSIPDIDNLYFLSRILNVKVDDLLVSRADNTFSLIYEIEGFREKPYCPQNLEEYYSMFSKLLRKRIYLGMYIYHNENIFKVNDSVFQLRVK